MTIWEWALVAWFVAILARNSGDAIVAMLTSAILASAGCVIWVVEKLL